MMEFLNKLVHNYKFVASVATVLALVVELVAPELQELVSQEFILGVLLTILGVGTGNTFVYKRIQRQ